MIFDLIHRDSSSSTVRNSPLSTTPRTLSRWPAGKPTSMMPTSVPVIAAGLGRLDPRDGGDLRTCTDNIRTRPAFFFAAIALLSCSVRHRFKTLT